MYYVQQKVAISPHEFYFFRINSGQLLIYILNDLIVFWYLRSFFLQDLGINLLLEELSPEAKRWKSCHVLEKLIFLENSLIFEHVNYI